ncbi:hypothetical protein Tco_0571680 [Tanacetum coccineum]
MGRGTIQLEDAVSTISGEYLLEFTSEYGIPEDLYPELHGPEETIVDFPEGKVGVYTKFFEFANYRIPLSQFLFDYLGIFPTVVAWRTSAPKDEMPSADTYFALDVVTLDTRRTPIQKQLELLLCLVGLSRRYFLGDDVYPIFLHDDDREMDLFNLISAPNPAKVKIGTRPRAAHEVPLLTVTATRIIDMEEVTEASESSGIPSLVKKLPLDFADEDLLLVISEGVGTRGQARDEVPHKIPLAGNPPTTKVAPDLEPEAAAIGSLVRKRRCERGSDGANANAPPKVLRKDHASIRSEQSTHGGKSLTSMGLAAGSLFVTPTDAKSVSDPDLLSYTEPRPFPEQEIAQSSEIPTGNVATAEVQNLQSTRSSESGKSTFVSSMVGSPEGIYRPGWGVTNSFRLDTPDACRDVVDHIVPSGYFSKLRHMSNADFLGRYNINLAHQVAMGSQLRLRLEQEVRLLNNGRAQIARRDQKIQVREDEIKRLDQEIQSLRTVEEEVHGLRNRTKNLETLMEAEVDMKRVAEAKNAELTEELESLRAQFSDLQKYEDDKVEQRCAEMDARLDALSIDFDEELYPHMLTAIAGRRWVIGHGIRLAVMKCAESTELRKVFANVVSAGIAKGMSEGLKHGVEHGKAKLDLAAIEAYDPEANAKYVTALHALKYLRYPIVDQLEKLKDAPIDLIMASLHLESDAGEDTPQWVRDLRPNSSQIKIPVYPEVSDPRNPWDFKEEILLKDVIAANISRAEKKKKCRVVCRTHGVGSVHHARSDGVPVSVPPLLLKVLPSCCNTLKSEHAAECLNI